MRVGLKYRRFAALSNERVIVVALIVLLLLVALLGGFGFAAHILWIVLLVAVVLWLLGFVVGSAESGLAGGRRRWYGRW